MPSARRSTSGRRFVEGAGGALLLALAACSEPDSASEPEANGAAGAGATPRVVAPSELMVCPTGPAPNARSERLCPASAAPEAAPDKTFIDCATETGCFAPPGLAPKTELVVVAYNAERGRNADAQLAAFASGVDFPRPDVLLLSEADRGCERTSYRNVIRDYAEALGMNYVYGVEFVELPETPDDPSTPCEHGNGILSRYPLANARVLRHAVNRSWYEGTDERRLGGRVAITADVVVGSAFIEVTAVHFESDVSEDTRSAQATELAELGSQRRSRVLIGGDMNAGFYRARLVGGPDLDRTVQAFLDRGYLDVHRELDPKTRGTDARGMILDVLVANGAFTSAPGVAQRAAWEPLSDHAPVWATVHLD